MYGYINVNEPYLYKKDEVLYNSMYCGICKGIGKYCGQRARLSLNYDITFFSLLVHNILGQDITIKKQRCITHWIKARPTAQNNELINQIADINVILAYNKTYDDIIDSKKGKFKRSILKKGYKKAYKRNKQIAELVSNMYSDLRKLEENKCDSVDIVCEPFAKMMEDLSNLVLKDKANEYTKKLFYNIGKWIYLIDAIDDFEKDKKSGNYNVFICKNGNDYDFKNFKNDSDLSFVLNYIFKEIKESFENIKFHFNTDLICNILFRGIPEKTLTILKKEK